MPRPKVPPHNNCVVHADSLIHATRAQSQDSKSAKAALDGTTNTNSGSQDKDNGDDEEYFGLNNGKEVQLMLHSMASVSEWTSSPLIATNDSTILFDPYKGYIPEVRF
ncbi:hypothetical protein PM082_018249 [Marasmius tenuissimus]|nr:hypothetical protein PM082_018249 [Marasmius tenuissimus]